MKVKAEFFLKADSKAKYFSRLAVKRNELGAVIQREKSLQYPSQSGSP